MMSMVSLQVSCLWVEQPETSVVIAPPDTPISGCITKIVADMHQAITNYQADLNVVMMVPQICYSH